MREMSRNWAQPLELFEFIKIGWQTGAVYYGSTELAEVSETLPVEIAPLECRLVLESYPDLFLPLETDSSLSDEEIDIKVWDADGAFADLVKDNGEGVSCEVFLWCPAVELLLTTWNGHLRSDEESDAFFWKGKIANGFRSPDTIVPGHAHYPTCQAVYGKHLTTLEEIAKNPCNHNAHLPGGTIGNNLFDTCDRKTPASCTARGIDPLRHFSHYSASIIVRNNQTMGPQLNSIARGNESNLKESVRVVMGVRRIRDCEILAFRRDYNNNNPDRGWFDAIYEVAMGPNLRFEWAKVNGRGVDAFHYSERLGYYGQPPLNTALSTHGYSGIGIFRYNYGWVNPANLEPNQMKGDITVWGLSDIRVYSDEETYTEEWSANRAWHIARLFADKTWGLGYDYARLGIASFIESAEFTAPVVTFTTPEGAEYSFFRGGSAVEFTERTGQQQIEDMCSAGRLSRPFLFQGKICIVPLRALTEEELADCPVFTDEGLTNRNIIFEEIDGTLRSTLRRSQRSDNDIPNRVESTFHDSTNDWYEATAAPAEDVEQQLKAGKVLGDTSRRVITKKYSWLGVVQEGHAVALNYWVLWFGEFCEGGIKNNLRIKFKAWYFDTLGLHPYKVIKVVSSQLNRYGFEYFMIVEKKRAGNLHVELTLQAWNNDEIADFDTVYEEPEPGPTEPGPPENPNPCILGFGEVTISNGLLNIEIEPC